MATVFTDDTHYKNIANAIRAKNGSANKYTPSEMSAAIEAIKTPSIGTVWAKSNLNDINVRVHNMLHENDIFVAACDNGLYYSTNEVNWTQSNVTSGAFGSVYYINGVWIAAGVSNHNGDSPGIYYSENGKTWIQSNITTEAIEHIYNYNGILVAQSTNTGLYYSEDGMTWVQSNLISGTFNTIYCANNVWVVNGDNIGLYYSTDGKTWTQSNLTSGTFDTVYYANNIWVATDGSNSGQGLCYSADGMTWTQSNITTKCLNPHYSNGIWTVTAITSDSLYGVYYSIDGITWMQSNLISDSPACVIYADDNIRIATAAFIGLYYSTDGKVWTQSNITSGCSVELLIIGEDLLKDVASGIYRINNIYITSMYASDDGVIYSLDGMNWIKSNIPYDQFCNIYNFKDICFCVGMNGDLYYSLNWNDYEARGNNWQEKTVTPTTSNQYIVPDSDYVGLSAVSVMGDADLLAENIKKDVEIFGVTGTYEGSNTALETCTVTIEGNPGEGQTLAYIGLDNNGSPSVNSISLTSGMAGSQYNILKNSIFAVFNAYCNAGEGINSFYSAISNDATLNVTLFELGQYINDTVLSIYCLLRNTPILMANGTAKMVQDITYDDELLVWDFDNGCFTTSKPLWIKKAEKCDYYYRCEFDNGSVLNLAGSNGKCHRVFSVDDNCFLSATDCVGKNIMTNNGVVKLLSCERIDETVDFYNIVTDYHFNLYANNILTSTSLNNLYPIKDMKFIKENRETIPFEAYKDIPEMLYKGLRLDERKPEEVEHINDYVVNMIKKQL